MPKTRPTLRDRWGRIVEIQHRAGAGRGAAGGRVPLGNSLEIVERF